MHIVSIYLKKRFARDVPVIVEIGGAALLALSL
jgi:hypothetical protein